MVGERIEIMVNLGGDAVGASLDLKAYNSGFALGFPGGEPATTGMFGSLLNNIDFPVLHINVTAATTASTPITAVPVVLASNVYWTAADATVTRAVAVTGGQGATPFSFDNTSFNLTTINETLNLNAVEKWTVTNNNIFGHSFHIHDIEFKIVARNGVATQVGSHEGGWKDTFYLPRNESVTFVAKFDDYADLTHPFMYNCHFADHEDGGMMGQFVVDGTLDTSAFDPASTAFSLYPNPANDRLFIKLADATTEIYYVTITTIDGRVAMMLPQPQWKNGIDVSSLSAGVYVMQMMDKKSKSITTEKFIKQ
jgi:hypothetical protein